MSKTCSLNVVSLSPTKPFDTGVSSSALRTLEPCAGSKVVWVTSGDEVFITIQGQRCYLWRAVGQDGDVVDILVTKRRDHRAAKRFFRNALKHQGKPPWRLVTDKLRTYPAAHREVFPSVEHRTGRYENNRAEVSHQHTREQERKMRRFKSPGQAQRFLSVHGVIQNLFRVDRHHLRAAHHGLLRDRAFDEWKEATCAY